MCFMDTTPEKKLGNQRTPGPKPKGKSGPGSGGSSDTTSTPGGGSKKNNGSETRNNDGSNPIIDLDVKTMGDETTAVRNRTSDMKEDSDSSDQNLAAGDIPQAVVDFVKDVKEILETDPFKTKIKGSHRARFLNQRGGPK